MPNTGSTRAELQKPDRRPTARKSWVAHISTAKGAVTIKRSAKSAPYAIQQNN